jgi:hypothetical protein
MTKLSVLGEELRNIANSEFNGDLNDRVIREQVFMHEVSRKFDGRGQSAIDMFLQSTSPSLHPNLNNREIAVGSPAGLESVVALHLRLAGG